ncbi:MAG: chemotaxis protein CheW [Pseudomonadota bacterium]
MSSAAPPKQNETLLGFRCGEDHFGVAASLVREVGRVPRLTRVPHAPASLMGLGNFRGSVLPVLSFARLMGRPEGDERRVIVLDTADPIALAVDAISALTSDGQVRRVDVEALTKSDFSGTAKSRAQVSVGESGTALTIESSVLLVSFLVSGQEFALPVGAVQEIVPLPDSIAALPHADSVVVGSIAVRDVLLPLLSLRALLALPQKGQVARARIVVVRIGTHLVGLVVDAIRGVIRVAESQIDPVPPVLARGGAEARIQAICRIEGGERLISVLAPGHLIREDITARLLQAGSNEDEMTKSMSDDAQAQFLIFRIGGSEFGLPIGTVIEVAALPSRLGRLPKAPAFVQGVMTLRNLVIPVIDQAMRFDGTPAQGARRRVIVVHVGELAAGFVVDAVNEVRSIPASALGQAPNMRGEETHVFDRVATLENERIVLIVSPQELLDRAERDLLAGINEATAVAPS